MQINAVEFRANCFQILDQVRTTHKEIIITKRGKPIAKIVHIEQKDCQDPLLGALPDSGRTVGDLTQPLINADDWEID